MSSIPPPGQYGLKEPPFSITPNPRFLYYGVKHREGLNHLLYGIRERKGPTRPEVRPVAPPIRSASTTVSNAARSQPVPPRAATTPPSAASASVVSRSAPAAVTSAPPAPRTAVVSAPPAQTYKLGGIIYRVSKPSAVINNRTVFIGERVGNGRGKSITRDGVALEFPGGQLLELTL